MAALQTDLVLEGGGVKGIGLVGALKPLHDAGYRFERIAGTSAGAIVGSVVAAVAQRGEDFSRLEDIMWTLNFKRFRDRGPIASRLGPFGVLADALAVVFENGAYEGDYLRDWLRGVLSEFGVSTFGDLRIADPGGDGSVRHRYRLMTTASDISRRRMVRFPWDCEIYGIDPDEFDVVTAVRASASVPYFFEPVQLKSKIGTSTLVDGAVLSNYPIESFDRSDEQVPRWPTIGIRLDALRLNTHALARPIRDPIGMGIALVETAIEGCQADSVLKPCNVSRSINVDATSIGTLDLDPSLEQQQALVHTGLVASERFVKAFDFQQWLRDCRGVQ